MSVDSFVGMVGTRAEASEEACLSREMVSNLECGVVVQTSLGATVLGNDSVSAEGESLEEVQPPSVCEAYEEDVESTSSAVDVTDEAGTEDAGPEGDDDEPPAVAALTLPRPHDGGDRMALAEAMVKYAANGKPCSEEEVRLVWDMAAAFGREAVFQADVDDALFDIGRCADALVSDFGWTLRRIGEAVGKSEPRMSQLRSGYRSFPTPESRMGMSFSACLEARKVHQRLPKAEKEKVTPTDILREIKENKHTVRQASAHFHKKALNEAKDAARIKYEAELAKDESLAGTAHNRCCLDVLKELPDESVKVLWADPPYAQFCKVDHEGYVSGRESGNGLRVDCENNKADAAVPIMLEMFRVARRVVRPNGCLVFWSAGMHEDRPEVIVAAREAGWRVGFAGYWKKNLTQPCRFEWPWTTCVERFLVFYPVGGAEPFDHSQELSRSDVITPDDLDAIGSCASPSQMAHGDFVSGRKNVGDVHMFEKPVNLCRYFIDKLTMPGDQVVDLFGCSGSMCIAAEQAKRRWVYIELNEDNFKWGVGRIADAKQNAPKTEPARVEYATDAEAAEALPF